MRRRLLTIIAACSMALVIASPTWAITYGRPDGNDHPYVGLVVFDDAAGPSHRCSGTLLSSTVFLTAGHCTAGTVAARVWFDADTTANTEYPFSGATSYDGVAYTHPDFNDFASFPATHDVGIVILTEPAVMGTYGQLPEQGQLDALARRRGLQDVTFTAVGYGRQGVKPRPSSLRIRYQATQHLVQLGSSLTDGYNVQTTNNPGAWTTDSGGTCSGDSGGPIFKGSSTVIIAVTSFGLNRNCKGVDFAYRVDIADSRGFIDDFIAVP